MKKKFWLILLVTVGVLCALYLAGGYVIYDRLSKVTPGGGEQAGNTPASFKPYKEWPDFDTSLYFMPDYQDAQFPSRQSGINLKGWYVPGKSDAPVVIVTHGLSGCKCDPNALTVAGMLHRNGFNVLLFDLREHGQSDIEDGRAAIGNEEFMDVLGAWDWLVNEKKFKPEQIGLFGESMGAGTGLIAFGQEPRLAAIFVDSPYSDLYQIITEELARNNFPTFFAPASILMARLISGDDLLAHSPEDAIRNHLNRPIYIVHGTGDTRISVQHSRHLINLAEQSGANLTSWIPEGVEHVAAEFDFPQEYEQKLVLFFEQALGAP